MLFQKSFKDIDIIEIEKEQEFYLSMIKVAKTLLTI